MDKRVCKDHSRRDHWLKKKHNLWNTIKVPDLCPILGLFLGSRLTVGTCRVSKAFPWTLKGTISNLTVIHEPIFWAEKIWKKKLKSPRPNEDAGPESVWENGYDWMKGSIEEAVEDQILTPAKNLRLQSEDMEAFEHSLVFEKFPEILVRFHSTFTTSRLDKMKLRAEFSNYIFQPTKFNFRKVVRITASIFAFLRTRMQDIS